MQKFSYRPYLSSLKLVFLKAVHELHPGHKVFFLNSLNKGLYGKIVREQDVILDIDYEAIKAKMAEIIAADLPFEILAANYEELKPKKIPAFREDIQNLMDTTLWNGIRKYGLAGYEDYFFHPIYQRTGELSVYDVYPYAKGFILKYPQKEKSVLPEKIDMDKMYQVFYESDHWLRLMGIPNAGAINKKILSHEISSLIRVNEVLHRKKFAKISEEIAENKEIKVVTIAGPSSSGKTTFANRLCIHLRADEVQPLLISLDNYYIGRANVPLGEDGKKDFECMEALDIELLNQNLLDLIAGKEVELPIYNFVSGEREAKGRKTKLSGNHPVIVIEGIHGLNEAMTKHIPKEQKFKVYISCLTQLNIDRHNRIASSDVREIRRIVRDSLSRGTPADETLAMWASVRRGEEKYIFPYQEEADVIFNSSLAYEMGVLKNAAMKELVRIPVDSPYYEDARRLLGLLSCFLPIEASEVPDDSILKEFIGRSFFYNY